MKKSAHLNFDIGDILHRYATAPSQPSVANCLNSRRSGSLIYSTFRLQVLWKTSNSFSQAMCVTSNSEPD